MNSLSFNIPCMLHIGEDSTAKVIADMAKAGYKKTMMHFGGGSIKKNGAYDDAVKALKENNIEFIECGGQVPNPRADIARKAMQTYIDNGCDCILAMGGGSILDSSKYIGLGIDLIKADKEVNVWDAIMEGDETHGKPETSAPIFTILTMSATGSESNSLAVITNYDNGVQKKYLLAHDAVKPKASGINPRYQNSLPTFQLRSGALDICSHLFEAYHGAGRDSDSLPIVQLGMIEGVINGVRERTPQLAADPTNLEARADIAWAAYNGLSGLLQQGITTCWSCHSFEHALSAVTDVTHGTGLSVLHVGLWRWMGLHEDRLTEGQKRMLQRLREKVFGGAKDMEEVVTKWRAMLREWEMPATLVELLELQMPEFKDKPLEEWLEKFTDNEMQRSFGSFQAHHGGWKREDVLEIFTLACQ